MEPTSPKEKMSREEENKRIYSLMEQDAPAWLDKANQLKASADVLYAEFKRIIELPPVARVLETKAFVNGYMLLTGLAFENLIKGVLIARNPQIIDHVKSGKGALPRDLVRAWKTHQLVPLLREVRKLSPEEADLLKRLTGFVRWGSRYLVPWDSATYHRSVEEAMRQLRVPEDAALIDCLFQALSHTLREGHESD